MSGKRERRHKHKFKVGQVVAMAWQPDFRPEYGRVESFDNIAVTVRFYDAENGDFYDRPLNHGEARPLTKRERGGA